MKFNMLIYSLSPYIYKESFSKSFYGFLNVILKSMYFEELFPNIEYCERSYSSFSFIPFSFTIVGPVKYDYSSL
jgi:hypothetical protein